MQYDKNLKIKFFVSRDKVRKFVQLLLLFHSLLLVVYAAKQLLTSKDVERAVEMKEDNSSKESLLRNSVYPGMLLIIYGNTTRQLRNTYSVK